MQKTMTRLFTAVLMAALLVSASIMSVSAADHGSHDSSEWTAITDSAYVIAGEGNYYLDTELNGAINGVSSTTKGALIIEAGNGNEVTLCMNGHSITGSNAAHAIYVLSGTVTLCNCSEQGGTIKDGTSGALRVGNNSSNLDSILTLSGNVHVDGSGSASSAAAGSAAAVYKDGHLILDNGSSISNNYISSANGVINLQNGTLTMKTGAEIKGNHATSTTDGAATIRMRDKYPGTFTMEGGEISDNVVAKNGGGVYVGGGSTFTMEGGTISGNTAASGTGVYVKSTSSNGNGTFTMTGGSIDGTIVGQASGAVISITGGKFTEDVSAYLGANAQQTELTDDVDGYLYEVSTVSQCPDHTEGWTAITDSAYVIASEGNYYLDTDLNGAIAGTSSSTQGALIIEAGNGAEVTLCMNGHSITAGSGAGHAIYVISGTVTLCNCSEQGGTIKDGTSGAVRVGNGSSSIDSILTLSGNVHVDGSGSASSAAAGSAAAVYKDGHLILDNGSSISNNYTASANGVVNIQQGTLTMKAGAEIKDNTVTNTTNTSDGAGTIRMRSNYAGTFTMEGGEISGNTVALSGGGVFVGGKNTFTMTGGTISGNSSSSNGTGVYVAGDESKGGGTFIMTNGTISGDGNLVYSASTATGSKVSGGTITKTDSSNYAVFAAGSGGLELGGTVSVTGDVANTNELTISGGTFTGDVISRSDGIAITITDGSIDGEVKVRNGTNGTFVISGGKFSADTDRDTLAGWAGDYTVAEIENGAYSYKVGDIGFYNPGAVMDHKSSLDFSLYLTGADTTDKTFDLAVSGGYTPGGVTVDTATGSMIATAKGIAAKEMHDDITFTVTDGDGNIWFKKTVSLYDAAEMMMNDENSSEAEQTMLANMINYGIAAQNQWGYNLENVAPLGTPDDSVIDVWEQTTGAGVSDEAWNDKVAATLSLKEKIQLNIYIKDAVTNVEGATFSTTDGITRVTFDNINVTDVKDQLSITVTPSSGAAFTVKYSIMDYVFEALAGEQAPLIKALQMYVDAVEAYIG